MLRVMHEHLRDDRLDGLASAIHPQAEMKLLVSLREPLRGRAAVIEALQQGRRAAMYRGEVRRFEWLDEQTVLTFGRARYGLADGGHADGRVFWLDELRDGMIWRVEAFLREADARRAYEARHP